jgi:hypothetical protein
MTVQRFAGRAARGLMFSPLFFATMIFILRQRAPSMLPKAGENARVHRGGQLFERCPVFVARGVSGSVFQSRFF